MGLTDEERERFFSVWDVQPYDGTEGPRVLVEVRGMFVRRMGTEEARALALRLLDVADEADGFGVSKTEPSPGSSGAGV